jgi:hypothetical protein
VLVEGNVLENVWRMGQTGIAVQLTPRNQDGKAPWSVVEDVIIRDNIIRHAGGAFNLSGWDDNKPSGQMRRVQISNNVVYDIDTAWGGSGMFVQVGNSPGDVVIEHNTVQHTGNVVNVYGKKNGAPWVVDGFVYRNNLSRHNHYGVIGDGQGFGRATLTIYFSNLVFESNVLAGGSASTYPGGNFFPTVADFDAAFVDEADGDFTLTPASEFRSMGSDGTALGADIAHLSSAMRGAPVTSTPATQPPSDGSASGQAVCRPGSDCESPSTDSHRRHDSSLVAGSR